LNQLIAYRSDFDASRPSSLIPAYIIDIKYQAKNTITRFVRPEKEPSSSAVFVMMKPVQVPVPESIDQPDVKVLLKPFKDEGSVSVSARFVRSFSVLCL
jgi:hypothetical protein